MTLTSNSCGAKDLKSVRLFFADVQRGQKRDLHRDEDLQEPRATRTLRMGVCERSQKGDSQSLGKAFERDVAANADDVAPEEALQRVGQEGDTRCDRFGDPSLVHVCGRRTGGNQRRVSSESDKSGFKTERLG